MKKKIILSIYLLLATAATSLACDICGCGVGSYYLGILPEYNKRFIGLRYQHKSLTTHLGPFGESTPLTTEETYQSAEIWAGWNMGKRFRLLAFVPYNFNKRVNQTESGQKQGLGDIAVMAYYKVFEQSGVLNKRLLVQSLWLGAGVKAPTGKYAAGERLATQESPNNFQLGTASTDFSLNAAYDIRYNDLGMNANLNYKMNTENNSAYRYGNKFSANLLVYYKFRIAEAITLAPNAGFLYERAAKDVESQKYEVAVSGGYSLSAVTGLELATKKLSFGLNYQQAAAQTLAGGRVKAGNRFMLHVSLPF